MAYTPNEPLVDVAEGNITLQPSDNVVGKFMLTDSIIVATLRDLLGAKALDVAIVDGSGDQITSFGGGTQYLEGTVTSSIIGNAFLWEDAGDTLSPVSVTKPLPVDQVDTASLDYDTGGGTVNQSVLGIALPGAGGPVAGGTLTNPVRVDPTGSTPQPVSGTVAATQGTSPWVVDQQDTASLDYDSDGGTVNQTVFGIALPGSGGPVAGGTLTNPVRVDPTGTTPQPVSGSVSVSGTVTANQGTPAVGSNAWPVLFTSSTDALVKAGDPTNNALRVNVVAALPTGDNAIGRVKLTDGTTVATVRELGTNDALNVAIVDGSGNQITSFGGGTQYLEGTVTSSIIGTAIMWEEATDTLRPVSVTKPLPVTLGKPSGSSRSSIAASATVVTLLSSNASRLGATIYNDGAARLCVALGSAATTSDFSVRLNPQDYYEVPYGFTGQVTGIWNFALGAARISELT